MLKIKRDINQQKIKIVDPHFVKFYAFRPLEVVDRFSKTQLQVSRALLNNLIK